MNIADRYESATPVNAQSGLGRARQGGEHPPALLSLDEGVIPKDELDPDDPALQRASDGVR